MDKLLRASLSHTHYLESIGLVTVPDDSTICIKMLSLTTNLLHIEPPPAKFRDQGQWPARHKTR